MTITFHRSSSDESDLPWPSLKKRKTMGKRLVFLCCCKICYITEINRNEIASDSEIGSTTPVKKHVRVTSDSEISSPVKRFAAM